MPSLEDQINVLVNNVPNSQRIVFFAGAGISVSAGFPLWGPATATALRFAKERGLSIGATAYASEKFEKAQYYEVFDLLERELPEPAFTRIATEIFCTDHPPSEIHKLLVRIPCRGIITTNFDECLSAAHAVERGSIPISEIRTALASDRFFVAKPHGSILSPRSMVLSTRQWQTVEANGDFKELLAQAVSEYQVVFVGYGFGDPDFEHIWSRLLVERFFRLPAIYCCREGMISPERIVQFRARNILVLEFSDDGSFGFVLEILKRLLTRRPAAASSVVGATLPELVAQQLEKYVFLCMHFSPPQQDRLVLVSKAIALDVFSHLNGGTITRVKFLDHLCESLGQDSALIRKSGEAALTELQGTGLIFRVGENFSAKTEKLTVLANEIAELEKSESDWVRRVLRQQATLMGLEIEPDDHSNIVRVFDRVLVDVGRDLAELLLFNRPPKDEFRNVDESVDEIARTSNFAGKRELYRRVVKNLLFEPEEGEEDLLFKKIQAYFISTAYVLNPTSERLLAQYARDHWVYFDSSIILPALALGHPSNSVNRILLRRTQTLGMRLFVIKDMFEEVWANVRMAIATFVDYGAFPTSLQDALNAYVTMHGAGHGNVFLEGYLSQLELDPNLTPQAYISALFFTSKGFQISPEDVKKALAQSYGFEFDALKNEELDRTKLEPIVSSIESLRKAGDRYHSKLLCEHEARQFYLIHLRREQNPELSTKIWYVTTDRFVIELQRLERDKFPVPVSYTPRSWSQYLALVDFESRSSRHFARLQPRMRYGVFSGDIGIDAIRLIVQEQKDLLQKGVVTLKELTDAAVTDFNMRQVIADVDRSIRQNETSQTEGRERIRQTISKVTGQFVAMRVDELEKLRKDAASERAGRIKVEKQLAKEKYVSRTLKAQQKARKAGKERKKPRH